MFSIEELIIAVFCYVDDLLKEMTQGQPIRQKGLAPAVADSEVNTMELVAEYQGIDADQALTAILPSALVRTVSGFEQSLCVCPAGREPVAGQGTVPAAVAEQLGAFADDVHLVDGIPIPRCCFSRTPRCRSSRRRQRLRLLRGKKADLQRFSNE